MTETHEYNIAGLVVRTVGDGSASDLARIVGGFSRFETGVTGTDADLTLLPAEEIDTDACHAKELDMFDFADAGADCHFCRYDGGYLFYMVRREDGYRTTFVGSDSSPVVRSDIALHGAPEPSLMRFGLWMMFNVALTRRGGIAIHTSVIVNHGRAVMFLGESGTGKSTHTRLWREHVAGSHLLNDDSPILRIIDGTPTAFGSPWSGKTPCYRNKSYPLAAIVRLSQAPHNSMHRLPTIAAIGALLPSCPPSFAYDAALQDCVCNLLSEVIATVPVFRLECLPDAAAAELSHSTIFGRTCR